MKICIWEYAEAKTIQTYGAVPSILNNLVDVNIILSDTTSQLQLIRFPHLL